MTELQIGQKSWDLRVYCGIWIMQITLTCESLKEKKKQRNSEKPLWQFHSSIFNFLTYKKM